MPPVKLFIVAEITAKVSKVNDYIIGQIVVDPKAPK
jgi:hypothetical protein